MTCSGDYRVLREFTFHTYDLTATAKTAATANGVNIDAQAASRIQHGRAMWKRAPPAGWGKYNFCVFYAQQLLFTAISKCLQALA